MADDQLNLKAGFKDNASAGVKKLGKALDSVRPSHGMAAAQKWMETFHKGADKTVAAVRPVSGMLNSVGVGGLAASLSIGEMIKQFRELADSTLTMKELGRQSGMTATEVARLQFAASRLHVDPAAMNNAIGSWSSRMVDFRRHTGDAYTYLMRQNADVAAKIASEGPEQGFRDTLDYLSRIPAAAMKAGKSAADAAQIQKQVAEHFGLGDVVPMLGQGPHGLAAVLTEAGRAVKPITQEMQAAADRFNEATTNFNQTWSNFKNDLGPSILDPLSHTLDKLDEGMKWAAKYPGDAAAAAATIAGSFAALYARHRLMRGSKLMGGSELGVAAGELGGAAKEQAKAGGSLIEAALELKQAAAALRGMQGAGGPGSGAPAEGSKTGTPGGKSPGFADLTFRGILAALNLKDLADGMPDQLKRAETDNAPMDPQVGREADWGDRLRRFFRGAPSELHPDDDRSSRARSGEFERATNTDGNALRRNDEMPVSALAGGDLKKDVQEGSKAGIIAGLREMAQQQELSGEGGPTSNAGAGRMLSRGAASMRYGRRGGGDSGAYRGTPVPDAPYNGKNIDGLTPAASKQYAAILGNRESGNRYGTTNPYGYAGRWQFGASALAENGYVRPGTSNAGLRNPGAWTGKGGASSMADWLANKNGVQDQAFGEYTNRHYAQLKAAGVIRDGMSPSEVAGWLAAAHLKGVGGAVALSRGHDNVDANGTSASSYRRMMQGVGASAPGVNPPGAGTPAPSGAAVTDAERFAAAQRILKGGRDPADRALVERYKAQQAQPEHHAAGGHIRGPGTGTSDSIPAWLSNGEFVVRAGAAGRFLPLLHAINDGRVPAFAEGGPVGLGVDKRFYPKFTPAISPEEGRSNRRSWLSFFQRPSRLGGMGASRSVALGSTAMMNGETGWNLNSNSYGWDVNGPSGGAAQWHDVTVGRWAGKLHRLSDLMTFAMQQHADWHDRTIQQAFWKKEATGSLSGAWHAMRLARMAAGTLRHGINLFENPADHEGELRRRLPNIAKLAREDSGGARTADVDPVQIDIHHHPHTGRPIVTAKAGRGTKLGIRTAPTMRPT